MCTLKYGKHCPNPFFFALVRIGMNVSIQLWRSWSTSPSSLSSRTEVGLVKIALILKLTSEHSSVIFSFFFINKIIVCNCAQSIKNPDITVLSCVSKSSRVWDQKGKGERSDPLCITYFLGEDSDTIETRGWQTCSVKNQIFSMAF